MLMVQMNQWAIATRVNERGETEPFIPFEEERRQAGEGNTPFCP